jgi:hypothetical protein
MFLTLSQFLDHFPDSAITILEPSKKGALTREEFIKKYAITKEEFRKKFIVTYSGRPTLQDLFDLKSVIKTVDDPRYINRDQITDYFYDIVVTNRQKYLTEFYKSYFELPNSYDLKWDGVNLLTPVATNYDEPNFIAAWKHYAESPDQDDVYSSMLAEFNKMIDQPLSGISMQKNDLSRKIVRNLNYLDILHNTQVTNTCKSKTSFWQTLLNVYNKLELEDRFFAPSSIGLFLREKNGSSGGINYNNFFYLFQQYQPKASILNPYTINWILKNLLGNGKTSGKKLFTPVLSWVSYTIAFMHSDWEHYVGVDVMKSVCDRTQFLFDHYIDELRPTLKSQKEIDRLNKKHMDLYCKPSESLLYDDQFIEKYQDYFDAILLCPPYFNMEIYPHGNQSIELYPNYEEWLTKYWEDTVALCYIVLKQGQKFAFIINNYISLKKEEYPLIQDLNMRALKYFKLVGVYNLLNRVSPLRVNHKKRTEMLFVYEK